MKVTTAKVKDHEKLLAVAKKSKYTSGFSNIIYSGPEVYAKGFIGAAKIGRKVVGFVCLRHAIRKPQTTIYDIGVDPDYKRRGVGKALLDWAMSTSPHKRIVLNVDKRNKEAIAFYRKTGFRKIGEGAWKNKAEYITMQLKG